MLQTFMYGPGDVRVEEVPEPSIIKPTDAIIKIIRTCICGSDLWPYRSLDGDAESGLRHLGRHLRNLPFRLLLPLP